MTERSRRAFLAAASGVALAATAGCSRLPVVGNSDSGVDYDAERLQSAVEPVNEPASPTYPGPVPDALATTHYERGRELLAAVPEFPEIPNGVVAADVSTDREEADEALAEPPAAVDTLDALGDWRRYRVDAATVRGAYEAATGNADRDALRQRRTSIRDDLHAFRGDWAYRAENAVEAVTVHRRLETLAADIEQSLVADRPFPDEPKRAVSDVGSLVGGVEAARAKVTDAAALRDTYRDSSMSGYWSAVATAAERLRAATRSTRIRVSSYVDRDAEASDFWRNVANTPAERLFDLTSGGARHEMDFAESRVDNAEYARAVTSSGRALVDLLALDSITDAIQNDEYKMPPSTDAVLDARERAVDAVASVDAAPLTDLFGWRARTALATGDYRLGGYPESDYEDLPDRREVRDAVANYALAVHTANAIPAVTERVREELHAAVESGASNA
ncbi:MULTISPECIES: hypothetical protein [Halobacterium]|uniref:hypothetical protein n=1 Tax=Halobacterium TaxID=2239 RepID=UPI00073E283A|nr:MULTISPECIES: hypothetical protein [Halobacterium]MCG1003334.1 hypothetical protein [Halobacterium noricense]